MDKKTILLVEDFTEVRELVKEVLETGYDFEVVEFRDGMSAIRALDAKKTHFDAAVLDIVMMGHGGSVMDYLKKIPQYKEIPIIFHTGLMKEQFDNRLLESAHYVQKGEGSADQVAQILRKLLC